MKQLLVLLAIIGCCMSAQAGEKPDKNEPDGRVKIVNASVILPSRVIEGATILIEQGRIVAVGTDLTTPFEGARVIDAAGRYAGVLEAGYLLDGLYVETIGDGIHVPEPLLQLIWKVKGPDRIVGVTDAMRGAGMPDGPTVLGSIDDGVPAIIEDGVAKLPDRSAFAGSVCTTDRVVRSYVTKTGATLPEAVQIMTLTPARLMKIDDRKGSIAPGKDADIVLFDDGINVSLTMIGGRVVYGK